MQPPSADPAGRDASKQAGSRRLRRSAEAVTRRVGEHLIRSGIATFDSAQPKQPDHPGPFYHREIMRPSLDHVAGFLKEGEAKGEFQAGGLERHPEILAAPVIVAAQFGILFAKEETIDISDYRRAHIGLILRGLGIGSGESG